MMIVDDSYWWWIMKFPIYGKITAMFQATNQFSILKSWSSMTPNAPDTRLGAHHWSLGAGAQHIAGVVDLLATNQPKWWMRMTWVIKCPHFSHHPTKIGIWSTRWLLWLVMSNIPKMGQLPTPGWGGGFSKKSGKHIAGGWATPPKNMSQLGLSFPNIWEKHNSCSKPPTSDRIYHGLISG